MNQREIHQNGLETQRERFISDKVKKEIDDFPSYQELITFSLTPPYFIGRTVYLKLTTTGDFAIDFGDGVCIEYSPRKYFGQLYDEIIKSYDGEYCSDEDLKVFTPEIVVQEKSKGRIIKIYGKQYITGIDFSVVHPDSIDVSKDKGLETIDLYQCYDLKSLDFSNNPGLKHLNCSSTDITELNLSENTKLETLHCSGTDIVDIDLSNLVNLNVLTCDFTNLIAIDLSHNSKLKKLSLDSCRFLQKLTLSKNIELEYYDINTIDSYAELKKDTNNESEGVVIFRRS